MRAFYDELQKEAASPAAAILGHLKRPGTVHAIGAGVGSGFGVGLGAGALVGSVSGGTEAYRDARAAGEGRARSVGRAVSGGLAGAVRGAAKGAVVGAAGGAALGAVAPRAAISATRGLTRRSGSVPKAMSDFGQRQVHSLTGWRPGGAPSSIERIGAGAAGARQGLEKAVKGGNPTDISRARGALADSEKAQQMGLTSLPGIARSIREHGVAPTVRAGVREQWSSSPAWGKALMVGLPAASVIGSARAPEQEGGPGRGERIGRTLGGALGYSMAPLSLAGSTALGMGLERAGGAGGRVVDKLRRRRPQVPQEPERPPATEPGDTGQAAVEHVYGTGFSGGQE